MPEPASYWAHGDAYERYMGRWSRRIAEPFVVALGAPAGLRWLDVGCGTGALASAVLDLAAPASLVGVDPAEGFLETARARVARRAAAVEFVRGDATRLPLDDDSVDAAVSGLVLNFVPSPEAAIAEMARVVRPGGVVAAYVWDYAEGMPLMSTFWDAAVELDPDAEALDQSARFTRWGPEFMRTLLEDATGIAGPTVETGRVELDAVFADFDDYWTPFLGGQGPAPAYATSLAEVDRAALRERVRAALPTAGDGAITLRLRAWTVRGEAEGTRSRPTMTP
ncbi:MULTISPECIES: class I SAM-dependent methyltransferase [unclassified Agromyces]|uniref:class I SAM-dependent methyltransferase n=1 Tax=unclassified Agromyces TaxID=2639701 RepID=UPI0030145BE8